MSFPFRQSIVMVAFALLCVACSHPERPNMLAIKDVHSLSNPQQVRVTTLDLNLEVHFDQKTLNGTAVLGFMPIDENADVLVLDTRKLKIDKAELSEDGSRWGQAKFELGREDPILGSPLTIHIVPSARFARITYATSPAASGLQWLTPEQTAGKKHPFVYSQSQADPYARSWIPIPGYPQRARDLQRQNPHAPLQSRWR